MCIRFFIIALSSLHILYSCRCIQMLPLALRASPHFVHLLVCRSAQLRNPSRERQQQADDKDAIGTAPPLLHTSWQAARRLSPPVRPADHCTAYPYHWSAGKSAPSTKRLISRRFQLASGDATWSDIAISRSDVRSPTLDSLACSEAS